MKHIIRSMQQQDLDSIHAIELTSHRAPWSRQILSDCLFVGYDCRVYELFPEGVSQIVGYVISRTSLNVYHILNLCIAKAYQGKGYGKSLLQHVLDSLTSIPSINTVILEVRPSNSAALALYEKFEFSQDAIKPAYYSDVWGIEDALVLKKIIN